LEHTEDARPTGVARDIEYKGLDADISKEEHLAAVEAQKKIPGSYESGAKSAPMGQASRAAARIAARNKSNGDTAQDADDSVQDISPIPLKKPATSGLRKTLARELKSTPKNERPATQARMSSTWKNSGAVGTKK